MIVPKILPDEHVLSWCGRIHKINNLSTVVQPRDSFKSYLGRSVNGIEDLASLAELSVESLLQKHTLIPFVRAVVPDETSVDMYGRRRVSSERTPKLAARWGTLRYCPSCVERDEKKRGFAYWRRTHQLPGMLWCPWHECQLIAVEQSTTYLKKPGSHIKGRDAGEGMPKRLSEAVLPIRIYIKLAMETLRRPRPIGSTSFAIRLNALLEEFVRIKEMPNMGMQGVNRIVLDAFPAKWLEIAVPQRLGPKKGRAPTDWKSLLFVWLKPRATERYLIVAAALHMPEQRLGATLFSPETRFWQNTGGAHSSQVPPRAWVQAETKRLAISIRLGNNEAVHGGALLRHAVGRFLKGGTIQEACSDAGVTDHELQEALRKRLLLLEPML